MLIFRPNESASTVDETRAALLATIAAQDSPEKPMFTSETCDKKKARSPRFKRVARSNENLLHTAPLDPEWNEAEMLRLMAGYAVPGLNDAEVRRQNAIAEFAFKCRFSGTADFKGRDLIPVLLTRLPGWQASGLLLEIWEAGRPPVVLGAVGNEDEARPIIRLGKTGDSHHRAIGCGADRESIEDGNCFFHAVWSALENCFSSATRRHLYGDHLRPDRTEAAAFFRHRIADYVLAHADIVPVDNRCDDVPCASTEIARSLFHAGKSLSSSLGWSLLSGEALRAVSAWLPFNAWPFQLYSLHDALVNKREYFGAFLNLLSLLPLLSYSALSADSLRDLFKAVDAAKWNSFFVVSGFEDLPPFFWTTVGLLALVTHHTYYARQNIAMPQTRVGRALTGFLQQWRHAPQLYGLIQTAHANLQEAVYSNLSAFRMPLNDTGLFRATGVEQRCSEPVAPVVLASLEFVHGFTDPGAYKAHPDGLDSIFIQVKDHFASISSAPLATLAAITVGYARGLATTRVSPIENALLAGTIFMSMIGSAGAARPAARTACPNGHVDNFQTDAAPPDHAELHAVPDLQTPHTQWIYLQGVNLTYVAEFLKTDFNHELFEQAFDALPSGKSNNAPPHDDKDIYDGAVFRAWHDYKSDSKVLTRLGNPENRYGRRFYSTLNIINRNLNNPANENFQTLKRIIIKIKAYETFVIRKRRGLPLTGREGPIVKLESVFELPIELPELPVCVTALHDYMATYLVPASIAQAPGAVIKGVAQARRLWNDQMDEISDIRAGLSEKSIENIIQGVKHTITDAREKLYRMRGTHDKNKIIEQQEIILQNQYAVRYLKEHVNLCKNFLGVLNQIEPSLPFVFPNQEHATVFKARALAIKAALKMLGGNRTLAYSIENQREIDYLDNFSFLTGSSSDVAAFVAFAEAIFYKALAGETIEALYRHYRDPARLLADFTIGLRKTPFKTRFASPLADAIEFQKNILPSDQTESDAEYYNQFISFRQKYQKPLAKAVSLSALLQSGQHPYWILTEVPVMVIHATVYVKPQGQTKTTIDVIPEITIEKNYAGLDDGYIAIGELIFCEMGSRDWTVISTLNGSCIVKPVLDSTMRSNDGLSAIGLGEKPGYFINTPAGRHPLWIDDRLFENILGPIFENVTLIERTAIRRAYLVLDSISPRSFYKNKRILRIVDSAAEKMLVSLMTHFKEAKYHKRWWQYLAGFLPLFDLCYRAKNDPDYSPGTAEITVEILSDLFLLLTVASPAARAATLSSTVLRESVFNNLIKGLRGTELLIAVMTETAEKISLIPLHLLADAGYAIFAFWEPLPLRSLAHSVYRGIRRFKFDFRIKKWAAAGSGQAKFSTLRAERPGATNVDKVAPNEARGLLVIRDENDFERYAFSYSYENDVSTRTGDLSGFVPEQEPEVSAPNPFGGDPIADPHGKVNTEWRRDDVSLNQASLGDAGSRFEGVYSIPIAGNSRSPDEWQYYIRSEGNVYEVRWDDDIYTWRAVNPLKPGKFDYAPPVKLNDSGQWVTHADIPGKGGDRLPSIRHIDHLIDVTEPQIHEVRAILTKSRVCTLKRIDKALKIIRRKKATQKTDAVFDIFMGRHTDAIKDRVCASLTKMRDFLSKIDISEEVFYKSGYAKNAPSILIVTEGGAALGNRKQPSPVVTVYVDAVVDISHRKGMTQCELENYMAMVLIHESYHATKIDTPDRSYARIVDNFFDISPIVALAEPLLRGENVHEIALKYGLSKSQLSERLEMANLVVLKNPDNLAYLTTLIAYIDIHPGNYRKFIGRYQLWKADITLPLKWQFKGSERGQPIRLAHTDVGELLHGNVKPLTRNGFLYRKSSTDIEFDFDVARHDQIVANANQLRKFSRTDDAFSDVVDTWEGSQATSLKPDGVWAGAWGKEHPLGHDISIIELAHGKSGAAALRIKLSDITEGHAIIVSSGELTGSTIAFAVDADYFYAIHAGRAPGDLLWRPSQEGVASIYHAYLALGGDEIAGLRISDDMLLVNERNELAGNRELAHILGQFDNGFFAFSSRSPDNAPKALDANAHVQWLDYAPAETAGSNPEKGQAYALLARDSGFLKITAYAEEVAPTYASHRRAHPSGAQVALKWD